MAPTDSDVVFLTYKPIHSLLQRRGKKDEPEEEESSGLFGDREWFLTEDGKPRSCKDLKKAVKEFEKAQKAEGKDDEEKSDEEETDEEAESNDDDSEGEASCLDRSSSHLQSARFL